MALWVCSACTAAYSVGAPRCPQCGSTDHLEDGVMPKVTVDGGATYDGYVDVSQDPEGEREWVPASDAEPPTAEPAPSSRPGARANRDEWVAYAGELGIDPVGMTVAEIQAATAVRDGTAESES